MSEHITHIAVYEDVARLVVASESFPEAIRESLLTQWDAGLLASASRGNHLYSVPLLERYREGWSDRPSNGSVEMRISAALGWLMHRAADLQMKALGRELERVLAKDPEPLGDLSVSDTEFEIFQDAVTFREVYDGGRVQPGSPYSRVSPATLSREMAGHPAAVAVDVSQVEPLLAAQLQTDLLSLQSFVHSETDVDTWIDTFSGRFNGFTEDLQVYIDAFEPRTSNRFAHEEKMIYYIDRLNWYNAGDAVIRWARSLQRGTPAPNVDVATAVDMARTQSQYAQALNRGYEFLQAAADFFEGRISKSSMYDAMENYNPAHRI